MNLEQLTLEELKALCYDQIMILNQTQNNINIIQMEIAKREKLEEAKRPAIVEKR